MDIAPAILSFGGLDQAWIIYKAEYEFKKVKAEGVSRRFWLFVFISNFSWLVYGLSVATVPLMTTSATGMVVAMIVLLVVHRARNLDYEYLHITELDVVLTAKPSADLKKV